MQKKMTNIWGAIMAIRRVIPEVLTLALLLLGAGLMGAQGGSSMPEGRIAGEIKSKGLVEFLGWPDRHAGWGQRDIGSSSGERSTELPCA